MVNATLLLHFYDDDGVFIAQSLKLVQMPSVDGLRELLWQLGDVSENSPDMEPPLMVVQPESEDAKAVKNFLKDLFLVASPDGDNLASVRVMQILPYDLSKLGAKSR
jgi:hypothetical protein